jgi:hypothetical protein
MRIFLDDQCFFSDFDNIQETYQSVELMVELMEFIVETAPLQLYIPADFLSLSVNGKTVADVFYAEYLDPSIRDLVSRFEQIVRVAELVPNNIAHGPSAVAGLREVGCGGLITKQECQTLAWWQAKRMHKVMSQTDVRISLRSFFISEKIPEKQLTTYSEAMFQSLYFHCPIQNVKNLGVKYAKSISKIINHFSYLNDCVLFDITASINDREITTRAGHHGVDMSPESNSTRNDKAAMRQREVTVLKVKITCEWHTKITPTRGRIHFYTDAPDHLEFKKDIGSKVIIGIMCRHLD